MTTIGNHMKLTVHKGLRERVRTFYLNVLTSENCTSPFPPVKLWIERDGLGEIFVQEDRVFARLVEPHPTGRRLFMRSYSLETIIVILLILWLLGWLVVPVAGGLIHLLLVILLIVVIIRVLQGRGPLP